MQAGKNTFALNAQAAPTGTPAAPTGGARGGSTGPDAGAGQLKKRLSFADAAEDVLQRHGNGQPMHYRDITTKVPEEDLVKTSVKTPEATLYAQVITENARAEKRGKAPRFVRHGKGMVGLATWLEPGVQQEIAKHNSEAEEQMLEQLRELEPADFEQLVGELLRALGITDVEVTAYHGGKGIDATGVYELAPGLVGRVAVQAKRQQANVGRPSGGGRCLRSARSRRRACRRTHDVAGKRQGVAAVLDADGPRRIRRGWIRRTRTGRPRPPSS